MRAQYKVSKVARLPEVANESSGITHAKMDRTFWTHNDSGGKPELYEIDKNGKLLSTKVIQNVQNVDWEDITRDKAGNIYIGDFGNNANNRQALEVYKLDSELTSAAKISFRYADQNAYPPPSNQLKYDCEAFFHYNDRLYLFSKNSINQQHPVRLYQLSDQPGSYTISPVDSIRIKSPVTSAAISPDGTTFALLTYGKILLFAVKDEVINFAHPIGCFKILKKQAEAIVFLSNNDLLITNEQRQIYQVTRR